MGTSFEDELGKLKEAYDAAFNDRSKAMENLYGVRVEALKLIQFVETLVSSIANKPKSFEAELDEITHEREEFRKAEEFVREKWEAAKRAAMSSGSGAAAGAAVAAMAPTAAMWAATTFGTASTGAAISSLSGAAATNAALAWLGGGALAAGGSGMAGGTALLALAGPVGWGIAGATAATSIGLYVRKKRKIDAEQQAEINRRKEAIAACRRSQQEIEAAAEESKALHERLDEDCSNLSKLYGADYLELEDREKMALGKLVNNTLTLAVLVNKKFAE